MELKTLTCIRCPIGCLLNVKVDDNEVLDVTGNNCKRGEIYARKEVINPVRTVTSTVKVLNGSIAQVACKTSKDIPKDKIFDVMRELKGVIIPAPVGIGDVIIKNVAGTEADIIATREIYLKKNV